MDTTLPRESTEKPVSCYLFQEFISATRELMNLDPHDPGLPQKVLECATQLAKAPKGLLLLADPENGVFTVAASLGLEAHFLRDYLYEPLTGLDRVGDPLVIPRWTRHEALTRVLPPSRTLALEIGIQGGRPGLLLLQPRGARRAEAATRLAPHLALALRNAQLVRDLKERNEELGRAAEELVRTEKLALLGRMAAQVAHQIRNPLSVIAGHAQLLLDSPECPAVASDAFTRILAQVRAADQVVRGLLELATPVVLEVAPMDLRSCMEAAAARLEGRARSQGVELRLALGPGLPEVWADARRLENCLMEIGSNALDAMPEGGRLAMVALSFGTRVELRVEDSGPGLDAGMRRAAFEPFSTTKAQGRGLGLYNVKRLCDAMGVEVRLGEGEGGSLRLSFPVGREKPRPLLDGLRLGPEPGARFGQEGAGRP